MNDPLPVTCRQLTSADLPKADELRDLAGWNQLRPDCTSTDASQAGPDAFCFG